MFFPLGAMIAGNPVQSGLGTIETMNEQLGQKLAGNWIQSLAGGSPSIPGAVPMPQGIMGQIGSGVRNLFGGGQQPQGPQMAQAPMASPMGGGGGGGPPMGGAMIQAPQGPPQAPQQPPMGGGGMGGQGNPISQMSLPEILQGIARANPGAPPAALLHAVKALQPVMNTMALSQFRDAQMRLGYERLGVTERGQDIHMFAVQNAQYWQGVANGTIDPAVTPPPQPPQRGAGPRSEAPAQPGQYSPQQVQAAQPPEQQAGSSAPLPARPVQTVPIRPAAQAQPEDPMQVARGRLAEGLRQEAAAGGGRAASLEDTPAAPQAAAAQPVAEKTAQAAPAGRNQALARDVIEGRRSPSLKDVPIKQRSLVENEIRKLDPTFNLVQAAEKERAAQRLAVTMNSAQKVRTLETIRTMVPEVDRLRELSRQMDLGKYRLLNSVELYGLAQKGDPLARQYVSQINTLKEKYAAYVNSNYAPTDSVWKLVNQQLDAKFGKREMNAALDELVRTAKFQENAIRGIGGGLVPGEPNPYVPGQQPQAPAAQSSEPVAVDPKTGRKAIYRDGQWQIQPAGQ